MNFSEHEFTFTAGAMVRKHFRMMLESERFSGRDIRWLENKGWFESQFLVRGKAEDAKATESRIVAYAELMR